MATLALILTILIVTLVIGVPLGYVLGIISIAGLWEMGGWPFLRIIATRTYSSMDSFLLVAVPFFVMAAFLMNRSGLTDRLIQFANLLIGHLPGGLSHVNIGSSIIFAGMTGTAVTDTVALGNVLIPAMKREGYPADYSAAVTAASSIIGPIIPPSLIMIIYSSITGLSIASLFLAGVFPGLLMGCLMLVVSIVISLKRKYPRRTQRASTIELLIGTRDAFLALIIPLIILGSIITGVATITESAAVALGYTLLVGCIVYRTIGFKDVIEAALYTARLCGVLVLVLATAHTFAWYVTRAGIPATLSEWTLATTTNPYLLLFLLNVFLLVIGMVLDILPAILILVPVLSPMVTKLGIDPLHFALVMMVNLNLGMITPPYGMTLLIGSRIGECSYDSVIKSVFPYLVAGLVTLALITYFPWLILFLPKMLGF